MNEELMDIPTVSLIEMVLVIGHGEFPVPANDGTEIDQIKRELQRRGEDSHWSFCTVN
jgi:hypothetical protein